VLRSRRPCPNRQSNQDVTALLRQWQAGNADALERLLPLVYEELRQVARARLRQEQPGTRCRQPHSSMKRTCASWDLSDTRLKTALTSSRWPRG
jgi:hypothetical protein